jgi:hypothetical protein
MAKRYIRIVGFFIWVVLMFAAQISPDSAISNVSKWLTLFHIPVPDALKNKTADVWIFWICLILGGLYFLILSVNFLYKHWHIVGNIKIGYSEFLRLCRVDDPDTWEQGFKIKPDGVWVVPPKEDDNVTAGERAALSEHPLKDLSKPALSFPCSLKEFNRFIKWGGMSGYVDQAYLKDLNNYITNKTKEADRTAKSATETISGKPDFKITLLHALVGFPPDKKDVAGVVVHLRIRNAGIPSIATDWKLTVKTPTEQFKPVGPATTLRELTFNTRTGKKKVFKESDFSFQKIVSTNPLKPADPPVDGWLLFYVKIPKEKVNWTDTIIQLTVEDYSGTISSPATKVLADWIQWE